VEAVREWVTGLRAIASMTDQIQRIDRGRQFDNALASSRVQRAEAELLTRLTSLSDARAQLRGLVGQPVPAPTPIRPLALRDIENLDLVVASHPQIRTAEATIEVAREQSILDQLYDRPNLSVEGFVSSGNDLRGRFRAVNNLGVQLVGNLSLLDGGAGAATSKASLLRVQQAERARDAVQVELLTALARLRTLLEDSAARSDSFERAYRQAITLAARMREQFRAGRRPLVDLLSQETEIYQTKVSALGERYDALLTQARMAHASGQLLSVLGLDSHIR
jgi:adhesin transport system outer membrane protein